MTQFRSSPEVTTDASLVALDLAIRQAELCDKLGVAVENAASASAESMSALRVAVAEFTIALRQAGTTPEAVLIRLKAVIDSHVFAPVWQRSIWPRLELRSTISTWCIEEYFRQESA